MSYDLFFKSGKRPIDRSAFEGHFRSRTWWQLQVTEEGVQALYKNTDTGVGFSFDWSNDGVAFNLNYFRPHIFGLEAAGEVTAFVRAFHPRVNDPQREGMGDGPYDEEGFVRGWNAGNEWACRDFLKDHKNAFLTMPRTQLERLWRWNFQCVTTSYVLQEIERVDIYVPKIWLALTSQGLRTYVVWDTTFSVLLPEVDDIVQPRDGGSTVLPRALLESRLASYRTRPANETLQLGGRSWLLGLDAREINFKRAKPALAELVAKSAVPYSKDHQHVAWDRVQTREVVEP